MNANIFPFSVTQKESDEIISIWTEVRSGLEERPGWNRVSATLNSPTSLRLVVHQDGQDSPVFEGIVDVDSSDLERTINQRKRQFAEAAFEEHVESIRETEVTRLMGELFDAESVAANVALTSDLKTASASIKSAIEEVREGTVLSQNNAMHIAMVLREAQRLQALSVQRDIELGENIETLANKHRLAFNQIDELSRMEILSDSINQNSQHLLELGTTALVDVRGVRIVESMRKKLAVNFGVTVMGSKVTVRFEEEKSLKQVSMQILSIVDSGIQEQDS